MKRVTSLLLAFVMCLTMAVPAFAAENLKFSAPDADYRKKAFVEDNNACVVIKVTKPKGASYTGSGLIVYDEFGSQVAKHTDPVSNVGRNSTSFHVWYDIRKELGCTLTPGTKYIYRFIGEVNGEWVPSGTYGLTTTGTAPRHTITFDAGGGVVRPLSIERSTGEKLGDLPTPVWGGYRFDCWTLNGNPVNSNTSYPLKGSGTLVAQWTKLEIPEKLPEPGMDPDVPPLKPEPPKIRLNVQFRGNISNQKVCFDPEHRGVTVLVSKEPDQLLTEPRLIFEDESGNEVLVTGNETIRSLNSRQFVINTRIDMEHMLRKLDNTPRGRFYFACEINGEPVTTGKVNFINGFYGLPRINSTLWLNLQHTGGSISVSQFPGHKFVAPPFTMTMEPGRNFACLATRDQEVYDHNTVVNTYSNLDIYPWSTQAGSTGFVDVKPTDWFSPFVSWAVQHRITAGVGNGRFDPNAKCLTSQIITFLWNAEGQDTPSVNRPFSDVKPTDWFDRAARWAYERDIVPKGRFNGSSYCTRADVVTYLWRLAGRPEAPDAGFRDVSSSAPYADAVNWAAAVGVTAGYTDGRFGVNDTCTRAQIATFLSNYAKSVE